MNTQHTQEILETACDCDSTVWCLTYKKCHRKMLGFEPYITPPQEPVAWLEPEWGEKICPEIGFEVTITSDHPRDLCWIPLYPHPPQREWQGLTSEEIKLMDARLTSNSSFYAGALWAEAKLKEKNT